MNMPNECTMLGHAYRDGYGKQQSYEEAARYYGLAARNGDPEGIYNLASFIMDPEQYFNRVYLGETNKRWKGSREEFRTRLFITTTSRK